MFLQNRFRRLEPPEPVHCSDQSRDSRLFHDVRGDLGIGDEDGHAVVIQLILVFQAFIELAVDQVVHHEADVGFTHGVAVLLDGRAKDLYRTAQAEDYSTSAMEAFNAYAWSLPLSYTEELTEKPFIGISSNQVEGAKYATSKDNTVNIHFTVSPEHRDAFQKLLDKIIPEYSELREIESVGIDIDFTDVTCVKCSKTIKGTTFPG